MYFIALMLLIQVSYFCIDVNAQQPDMGVAEDVYGNPIRLDALSNLNVGNGILEVSLRFKAIRNGSINAVRWFDKFTAGDSGYSAGTGGTIRLDIKADSGSPNYLPTGSSLANATLTSAKSDQFPLMTLSNSVTLVAGQRYHLVFSNTHSDPDNNFVSVNNFILGFNYINNEWIPYTIPSPRQLTVPDLDAAVMYRWSGGWVQRDETPIYEVYFTDDDTQGIGYMESWIEASPKPIGGGETVRQLFTVSRGNRVVKNLKVRVFRRATTPSSPLTITLTGNTEGTMASTNITGTTVPDDGADYTTWTFSTPQTLVNGRTYQVALSSTNEQYNTFVIRGGDIQYGFENETTWKDGKAQYWDGDSWEDWDNGSSPRQDGDLQLFFELENDTTDPVVTITGPTSNTTYATATMPITTIAGTATDAVGTTSVTWANAATSGSGSASGCSGQTSCNWSVSSIALNEGSNAITITGTDAASNDGTDTITVTLDSTAPSWSNGSPSGTLAAGTTSTSISLTTNETATCKYGTTASIAYASQPNTFSSTNSTSHSTTVSGLSDGGSYTYYVRCQDALSNVNTSDFSISFSVAEPEFALPGIPSSLSKSASTTPSIPGPITSLSTSASTTPTMPGAVTSLSDSAASNPTFPDQPTGVSIP